MSDTMHLRLDSAPTPPHWGPEGLLSGSTDTLTLHTSGPEPGLRRVQAGGRRLSSLGIPSLTLTGDGWDPEAQWALAQGYAQPRGGRTLIWADDDAGSKVTLSERARVAQWVRDITNACPQDLAPEDLARQAADFLSRIGGGSVTHKLVSGEALREQGLVGIHGVGRGSDRPPALLSIDYNPSADPEAPVAAALVGKGITFDSGGYSMKKTQAMLPMKGDMGGAAMVTGGLALAMLKGLQVRVRLFLCCAENLISGHAYKLGDILTYRNGVSVEVVNTDAEGRLVLADGLILASETGAPLVLDAATLTGAAHTALGNDYNAVFALDEGLRERLLNYAREEHELHWPLPLQAWHRQRCPSDYADTANSRPVPGGGPGGASNAAGFLSRFVAGDCRGWIHLDLAAAFRDKADDLWAAGATAMGIRTIARTLLEETTDTA